MRCLALAVLVFALGCDGPIQPDAGLVDAGIIDAGAMVDAGSMMDASMIADASTMLDAGASVDCSESDASCRFDPLRLLTDPYLPARALPGRMRLVSSREPEPQSGNGNDDHDNYVRIEPRGYVLLDAEGPGVLTRLWVTGREARTQRYEVIDQTIIHMEIDGTEVELVPGELGIPLGMLTSGEVEGFPYPWVADRAAASNAQIISVPIPFQESLLLWIEEPPAAEGEETWLYYQADWRELPEGMEVESFDGVTTEAERQALEDATAVWIDRTLHVPGAALIEEKTLRGFEKASVRIEEPTTIRALRFEGDVSSFSSLEAELRVDGEIVAKAPLLRLGFAASPTEPSDSALATVSSDALTLRYPFPVERAVELSLYNTDATPVPVRFGFEHDPGEPDSDLGKLRTSCGTLRTPIIGQNFAVLDVAGRRGHYAGQFLVVQSLERGLWVLEGDHEIYTDGEWLLGTGLEDYFGGSFYYLAGSFALPHSGASGLTTVPHGGGSVSQYRHHLLDTIPFESEFRFEYETFVAGALIEHCTFWYEAR